MSSSASGTDPSKKDPFNEKPENGKRRKGKKKEEETEKKMEEVKKVSPVARFFSSMKVKFTLIIAVYTLLSVVVGCAGALLACLDLYENTDVLSMKEKVQSVIGGMQIATNVLIQRGGLGNKQFFNAFKKDFSILSDINKTEEILAKYVHDVMAPTTDGSGLFDYKFMPMNLFMLWDKNWTERLVYYRPCQDNNDRSQCNLTSREYPFMDYEHGDYRLNESNKDKVPKVFRNIREKGTPNCDYYGNCTSIIDIPNEEGGPMMYFLSRIPLDGVAGVIPAPLRGWHFLWASNMLFFNHIAANRTGFCVSSYSSSENKTLPEKVAKEYEIKKKQKEYGLIDPHDSFYDNRIWSATFFQDTDEVTLAQKFYSSSRYDSSDRQYCDKSYDHGPAQPRSKSTVYLAFQYYDFNNPPNKSSYSGDAYMLRIDYHNPISQRSFTPIHAAIVATSAAWLATVFVLVIYFISTFLVPLERMRKMRSEFIKTSLAGLDDDGTLAKEIFGDMVDDDALIDANGDEIRVMLTLQERLDGFYTGLIKTRTDELAHNKATYLRRINAQKVMNYFMFREDEDLFESLPGLLNPKEVNRHFRRTALSGNMAPDSLYLHDLMNARHLFRQFKTILSSEIAIEFFKCFCIQRGRSTVNSLFFVMDVSWLNQVEDSAKKGTDDFLSTLFSDSLSQSSNPPSSVSSTPVTPRRRPEGLVVSVNSLSSLGDPELVSPGSELSTPRGDLRSPRAEPDRPHHSHFAKSKEGSFIGRKASDSDIGSAPNTPRNVGNADGGAKKMKVPFASSTSTPGNKQLSSSSSLPSDSELSSSGNPQKLVQAGPAFASTNGDTIAHFIYESYFGHKSLAHRDAKHAALLGCSQIHDYLALRDGGSNVTYSPIMFNNLLAAVVKKFSNDVIPQFLESPIFQIMVYCLILTNYFTKTANKGKRLRTDDDEVIARKSNALVNGVWPACHVVKQEKKDDDDTSSSSSDDDDDDDDKHEEEKPKEEEEKKDEKEEQKEKKDGDESLSIKDKEGGGDNNAAEN